MGKTKLSDGIARHIRKMAREGTMSRAKIAFFYNLTEEQVAQIISGRSWRLVEKSNV